MGSTELTAFDFHLLAEGTHSKLYEKLGAHPVERDGRLGTRFAVWAPNAESVEVVGDWNDWRAGASLEPLTLTGLWHGFGPGVGAGQHYKYRIRSRHGGYV